MGGNRMAIRPRNTSEEHIVEDRSGMVIVRVSGLRENNEEMLACF